MSVHVIIDGYNLAHALGLLDGFGGDELEQARDDLCDMLAMYKKAKAHKITVVFDAQYAPEYETRNDTIKGIRIKYSPHGRLADSVIKNMARKEKERAIVVSSDRDVAESAQASGAAAVSSQEFQSRLIEAMYFAQEADAPRSKERRIDTRKKGPGFRSKKKRRKTKAKAQKL
ncbi:NYN domain-containing protein [Desulfatibacillum aliphaticivorans]|uniref:NYN domain-containing protein n=1 Tax=Desulfatibacillum aliphaticivorans TaxID=218208 RepID=UPI0001601EE4|nr:NYN domain-containing protein [Desulfatibacillum aliphaticivorans]